MYAHIRTVMLRPGTLETGLHVWRERLLPRLQQQPGFQGLLLLADGTGLQGVSLTLWAAEADARVLLEGPLAAELHAVTAPLLTSPPAVSGYQVLLQVAVPPPRRGRRPRVGAPRPHRS